MGRGHTNRKIVTERGGMKTERWRLPLEDLRRVWSVADGLVVSLRVFKHKQQKSREVM